MFKLLKEKLKEGIKKISGKIEEEGVSEEAREEKPIEPEKKGFFSRVKERFGKKDKGTPEKEAVEEEVKAGEDIKEKRLEEQREPIKKAEIPEVEEVSKKKEEIKEVKEKHEPEEEKKGFFYKIKEGITTKKIDKKQFEQIFWELEMVLLENNVAVEVIEKIKDDLVKEIVDKPLPRGKVEEKVKNTLRNSIEELLGVGSFNFLEKIKEKKPFVICFVGINGSGKTTTIAKIAKLLMDNNLSIILAASDTFRAASIEQLQEHADRLKVRLIKHSYGSDPAAVAFDAIKHAKAKNIDVVLIDTAGRMHSNVNLTDEMKKIVRVAKPDLKIFVGESITGNDCVEQAKTFNEAIGIDAIILAKADVDEKGGAAISVSYVTGKPIAYIGTGQGYKDLKEFDSSVVVDSLGLA